MGGRGGEDGRGATVEGSGGTRVTRHTALERLDSLSLRGIKLGLAAIDSICARLGRPESAFPSVLIGGTNGKGSTAATLASLARAAGRKAGLYTSPHLIDVTERVRLDERDVLPAELDSALSAVFSAADRAPRLSLTYFEAITAAAFVLFRDAGVQLAILEVGLGGRLDATNVAPASLSVVTSIAMDHMADLGDSPAAIAREKAGIFRRGRPALFRAADPEALGVLAAEARRAGAELHDASAEIRVRSISTGLDGTHFDLETPRLRARMRTPLPGAHQAWNAALAVRAVELLPEVIGTLSPELVAAGLAHVRWAGRLERLASPSGRPVLLDGCHNPDGARALAAFLDDSGLAGRAPLVFGAMSDKDVEGIAAALFPKVSEVILVRAPGARAADPAELLERVGSGARKVRTAPDFAAALALLDGTGPGADSPPIIVAGSLYLVGEARAVLSGNEK